MCAIKAYDSNLSGEIASSDLLLLLQDMGMGLCGETSEAAMGYTRQELSLVLRAVDKDRLGSIEFVEFVRWWTSGTGNEAQPTSPSISPSPSQQSSFDEDEDEEEDD